jgi:hypothetical protein
VLAAGDLSAGAAPAAGLTGALSGLGSTIGGGLSSIASAAVPLLTNPITLGIGGAILAAGAILKATQVHPVANQWVQGVQNPFDQQVGKATDAFTQALGSGQMTQAQAVQAYQGMQQVLQQYQQQLQDFSTKGSKQKIVANQAQSTFNQWYGPNGSSKLGWMANQINQQFGPGTVTAPSAS